MLALRTHGLGSAWTTIQTQDRIGVRAIHILLTFENSHRQFNCFPVMNAVVLWDRNIATTYLLSLGQACTRHRGRHHLPGAVDVQQLAQRFEIAGAQCGEELPHEVLVPGRHLEIPFSRRGADCAARV